MNVLAESFWIQKRGCAPEEYEDAACPPERSEYEQSEVRLAVADGATESIFAKRWAEQLVVAVRDGDLTARSLPEGIAKLRADWREWLARQTLPWYAEEKARQGAFAALVALELNGDDGGATHGNWLATAVGDSCLFHVRDEKVLIRFPIASAEGFDNRPFLLGSLGANEEGLNEAYFTGTWNSADSFYLMTDALARWFLKHVDAGGKPSDIQGYISTSQLQSFSAWIESLRDEGLIHNDDCTMIRVSIR